MPPYLSISPLSGGGSRILSKGMLPKKIRYNSAKPFFNSVTIVELQPFDI
jgi:hypothetical protein